MGERLVKATISPIKAKDIRLPKPTEVEEVVVDPMNPLTREIMHRLPSMTDSELQDLKSYLQARDSSKNGSMSKVEDVNSWVGLVNKEIAYRAKETRNLVVSLLSWLTGMPRGRNRNE